MTGPPDPREERVLVHTTFAADAVHTARLLAAVGVTVEICADAPALCRALEEGAGAVFLAEETLVPATVRLLLESLDRQPPWSDLPVVVSVVERELIGAGYGLVASLGHHVNVTLLERPVNARSMVAAVQSALRARRRQYEARNLVEQLGRARDMAEASNRAKDDFLATLSHELRTPLNAILGWTRMLRSNVLEQDKRDRALATVERNAVAQTQLIEDLLDVSRAAAGKMSLALQPMDAIAAVQSAIDAVKPAAQAKRIALETTLEPGCPIVADRARLEQVMWNLLSNAIKFTPEGGRIEVELACRGLDAEFVVKDDGVGISSEFLPHVFERFRQADPSTTRAHGGLGIGLAIVKSIVELHGGAVSASSSGPGRGSTFVVRIPLAPEAGTGRSGYAAGGAVAGRSAPLVSNRLAGLRILVVDDEPETVELMASILQSAEATVRTACSAAAGYDLLVAEQPDVLVSDIGMQGEDGFAFIRRVRAAPGLGLSRIPALAVTAYARVEDRTRALVAGFDMHVAKPVEPAELVALVEMLARQFRNRPAAAS